MEIVPAAGGAAHQIAAYCLDWDNYGGGRTETLSILDGTTGATLDTRTISSFQNGVWLVWTVSGHVKLQVTNTNGAGNAVISALMFDAPATTPSSGPSWSQSFTYDGFSNLTNVNAVNAPGLGVNVNPANNRLLSDSYDNNSNDISIGSYDA